MAEIWSLAVQALVWLFLLAGAFACVVGSVGLMRFPDVYTRMHAAGVIDTGGPVCILLGLMIHEGFTLVTAKLAFILFFILFTSPTATHALASSATGAGLKPWTGRYGNSGADP